MNRNQMNDEISMANRALSVALEAALADVESERARADLAEARLLAELGQPFPGMPEGWRLPDCGVWRRGYGVANLRAAVRSLTYPADDRCVWAWAAYMPGEACSFASGEEDLAYDAILAAEAALNAAHAKEVTRG